MPINTSERPCPFFTADATCGRGMDGEDRGFGGEAFGSDPEDDMLPEDRRGESGLRCVELSSISDELLRTLSAFGIGMLRASARATTIAEAVGKRAVGSFARARRITPVSVGGIAGLMSIGAGGAWLMCCIMISVGVLP